MLALTRGSISAQVQTVTCAATWRELGRPRDRLDSTLVCFTREAIAVGPLVSNDTEYGQLKVPQCQLPSLVGDFPATCMDPM
jgi:hypothetical protein